MVVPVPKEINKVIKKVQVFAQSDGLAMRSVPKGIAYRFCCV